MGLKIATKTIDSPEITTQLIPFTEDKSWSFDFDVFNLMFKVVSKKNTMKVSRLGNRFMTDFILYNTSWRSTNPVPKGAMFEDRASAQALTLWGHNFSAFPSGNRKGITVFCIWNNESYALIIMLDSSEYFSEESEDTFEMGEDYGENSIIQSALKYKALPRIYERLVEEILNKGKNDG